MQSRRITVVVMGGQVFKIEVSEQKIRDAMGSLRNAGQEMHCELVSCHGGRYTSSSIITVNG